MTGTSYATMFIHFDDNSKILFIGNEAEPNVKSFEIKLDLVEDFISGKRKLSKYNIEYFFNLANGIIEEEMPPIVESNLPFIIPTIKGQAELTVQHLLDQRKWTISVLDSAKKKLEIMPTFNFYVCSKYNLQELYRTFSIEPVDLIKGPVDVKFEFELENILDNLSVAVNRKLYSYRVISKDDK
jgi:hypothetical protein